MPVGKFLAGIAALVYDPRAEKYLLLRRAASKDVGAGDWECPTGRVDQGEGFEDALHREVAEELGVPITVEFLLGTTRFYRGAAVPENELLGVLYSCAIADPAAIVISAEHDAHRWMTVAELEGFLAPDHWLRWVVARAELLRARVPRDVRDVFGREGFVVGGR